MSDIVRAAIDADVIKTYVSIGPGIGFMAELAWDPKRDRGLGVVPAGELFGLNRVRLLRRRDAFLRGFATAFVELFIAGARS